MMSCVPRFARAGRWCVVLALVVCGCKQSTPRELLVGKWTGAPNVKADTDKMVDSAAEGQEVNPLVRGGAQFLGKVLARATMGVELDLRASGVALFGENAEAMGMLPDSDGEWEILKANEDIVEVRLKAGKNQVDGKIIFKDDDNFTLKLPPLPETAADRAQQADGRAQPDGRAAALGAAQSLSQIDKKGAAKSPLPPKRATSIEFRRSAS